MFSDHPNGAPRFHLSRTDAVEFVRRLPPDSVDLIVTDPPYESLEKHRAVGTTTRLKNSKASSNDWFDIFPNERFEELFTELYRVLRKNRHFYLYCDAETMFVAKPIAERCGFRFWKPLVWDKCLGPETPVWTSRGVIRADEVSEGDQIAIPESGFARVRATRSTQSPAIELALSDGSTIVASRDHRFVLNDGRQVEAAELHAGSILASRPVRGERVQQIALADVIPDDQLIYELPDNRACLWCGAEFDCVRGAAAHQARFCEEARCKIEMARELGISAKRLRRWLSDRRIPAAWAAALGIEDKLTARVRCYLQNDSELWYPEHIELDYRLGKIVGLFAAAGYAHSAGIVFALHANEKHLQDLIARFARSIGARAIVRGRSEGHGCTVEVSYGIAVHLMRAFVGGTCARTKFFRPLVYRAPREFQQGVFDGLIEGDGHWSHDEQRETLNIASLDLAMFAHRFVLESGVRSRITRFENDHAGGWRVRSDPNTAMRNLEVVEVRELGAMDLVDISIDHPDQLYLLGNGLVTHNCKIGMGYHYRARYELILFFEKGKRKLNDLGVPDIISEPRIHRGYPAEKPPAVSRVLITQSSQPGELVIDPFMGSGSAGVAAVTEKRHFLGNDLCEEAVAIARKRLIEAGATETELELPARGRATGAQLQMPV